MQGDIADEEFSTYFSQFGEIEDCVVSSVHNVSELIAAALVGHSSPHIALSCAQVAFCVATHLEMVIPGHCILHEPCPFL